jgi:proline racemase
MMDRAPCGTGVSSRLASLSARGALSPGQTLVVEGVLDTVYEARIAGRCRLGGTDAIVPEIGGRAWITALSDYIVTDDDPFPQGYLMTDLWPAGATFTAGAR